ncbi:hypothetical protein P7K49_018723, partial [Saguinus oedipus]
LEQTHHELAHMPPLKLEIVKGGTLASRVCTVSRASQEAHVEITPEAAGSLRGIVFALEGHGR